MISSGIIYRIWYMTWIHIQRIIPEPNLSSTDKRKKYKPSPLLVLSLAFVGLA